MELKAAGQWEIAKLKANVPTVFTFNLDPKLAKQLAPLNPDWFTFYFAVNPTTPDGGVRVDVESGGVTQLTSTSQGRVGFKYQPGAQQVVVTSAGDCTPTVIFYYGRVGLPRVKK